MKISKNIPLDVDRVLSEIFWRSMSTWNGDMTLNSIYKYPMLDKLFKIINSGIPEEDFFYKGDLFRIHHYEIIDKDSFNPSTQQVLHGFSDAEDKLLVVPQTRYDGKLSSFSKSYDFTKPVWKYVNQRGQSRFIHANTGDMYGIDVNMLLERFGTGTQWPDEQEVLFPIRQENVIAEYNCTPSQMKYVFENDSPFVPAFIQHIDSVRL